LTLKVGHCNVAQDTSYPATESYYSWQTEEVQEEEELFLLLTVARVSVVKVEAAFP
jgi:uncharacterized protein involved in tolerance to divalent cations